MLSLGYFYQHKKLSLHAQEAEAHGAFLRIIDLMQSAKPVDHVEAISLCGQICSGFASPTIVNSAFMRIAEAFRTGSNTLQMEILRVVQKNIQHLPKIRNHGEFIRPIFTVMYSNDPVARAITLRLLAAIAVSIPNQLDVHHAVRVALQSNDRNELQAALFACRSLAKVSGKFAEEIAADVAVLVDKPGLSDDERIATLQIIPYIAGLRLDTGVVRAVVTRILRASSATDYHSSRLIETCLRTISDLLVRGSDSHSLQQHILLLASYVDSIRQEVARPAAAELLRFFRLCTSLMEPDSISTVLLQLLESGSVSVVNQGVRCTFAFVNDRLARGSLEAALNERILQNLTDCTLRLQSSYGACAFAVLCRIIGLTGADAPPGIANSIIELINVMHQLAAGEKHLATLKLVLLGLNGANLSRFPPPLASLCIHSIERFSFPGPSRQLVYLRHLGDLLPLNPKAVGELLERSTWNCHLAACDPDTLYRTLFQVVALRFRLSDQLGGDLNETKLAEDVTSFGLSHWDLYRLVRTSMCDGRYPFAVGILEGLVRHPHSASTAGWLNILLSLAQAEASKAELRLPGVTLLAKSQALQRSILSQMDTYLSLSSFCGSNRLGLFRERLLELRTNLQQSLLLLVNTIENVRLRAADMKELSGVLKYASSQFGGTLAKLKETAEESVRLYRLAFDADGPSLAVVRFYYDCCTGFGKIIAIAMARHFGVDPDGRGLPASVARIRGTAETFDRLDSLPTDVKDETTLYGWLKEIFLAATFFLTFPVPIPRYFFQQFQQTTLSVVLTPAPTPEKEYVQTLNMDTRFTLKVDGILTVDCRDSKEPTRRVKAVRVATRIILVKALPFTAKAHFATSETASEGTVQDIRLDGLNFFSHTFVMNMGYPGVYRVEVDCQFHDDDGVAWTAMQQGVSVAVRVVESAATGLLPRKGGANYEPSSNH
ncbi:putative Integrator complex subunit 7 [Hypsibius exemplaris]|uniref:Integrator complex subunit 7 n=1 Tax=Hypsibius exemplaris TaxID=2072580 RepID=A0A1W0W9V8_HYPEX|nr:putative Integrator complex subunit 7 [Hypsibius exemplaris]